jgi:TRAP-type C4-dicarboxylate transport system permease small subunit
MRAMKPSLLHRIDDAVYAAERLFVVTAMSLMVLIVFFEVVDRRLEAPESKLAGLMRAFHIPAAETTGPIFGAALLVFLLWFGLATLRRREKAVVAKSLEAVAAVAGAAVLWGLGWLMIHRPSNQFYTVVFGLVFLSLAAARVRGQRRDATIFAAVAIVGGFVVYRVIPEGYSWAKEIAMMLLVWTGLVGASMASHQGRHIDIDMARKLFPAALKKTLILVAALVNVAFCALLVAIGVVYVFGERGLYNLEGHMQHTGLPDWILGLAIPWAFTVITLRAMLVVKRVAAGELEAKGSSPTAVAKGLGEH